MTSTFMGLEISRRGMVAQQGALYVTGQNVSNASTAGYTRQTVNLQQTSPYPGVGMNAPQMAGQMGAGVEIGSIQRVRDSFLDTQYRTENNQLGYWQASSDSLSQMEGIMNEPSDSGLSNAIDQFWQSLQDLSANPTDSGALSVVRQRGAALADTFNYLSNSLSSIQGDQKTQIGTTVDQVNTDLKQLNTLNQQIGKTEASGNLPNDLYDHRDRLLDDLSSMINIKVDYVKPAATANSAAQGKAVVSLVSDKGDNLGALLGESSYNELKVNYDGLSYDDSNPSVKTISLGSNKIDFSSMNSSGKLKSLIESYGYEQNGQVTGTYTDMLEKLDNLAYTFATEFNNQQQQGQSAAVLKGTSTSVPAFFSDKNKAAITSANGFASRMQLSHEIQNSADHISTAAQGAPLGDATNVTALANVIKKGLPYGTDGQKTDFQSFYQGIIGQLGVDSQSAAKLATNSSTLQQSADQNRQSVSSVSLDEEMTNMIKYQQAYSASAKMISVQNDILNTIINGLGVGAS
jgi:flagellar hook-associated protein 1 FlgK